TRFRSGDSPYRMGFEPIRLLQRISSVALSPPIPTLQALPGATMFIFFQSVMGKNNLEIIPSKWETQGSVVIRRFIGVLEYWSIGVMECWSNGKENWLNGHSANISSG
ncbi:MAG: hypothetical protein ABIN18_20105, partial [Pseudomonadota bacterium]